MIAAPADDNERIRRNLEMLASKITHRGLRPPEEEFFGPWLFRTLDAFPTAEPWLRPVQADDAALPDPWPAEVQLAAGQDGLFSERYDVVRCPGSNLLDCVQIWATGRFGSKKPTCWGFQLERQEFRRTTLKGASLAYCPMRRSQKDEARLRAEDRLLLDKRALEEALKRIQLGAP